MLLEGEEREERGSEDAGALGPPRRRERAEDEG